MKLTSDVYKYMTRSIQAVSHGRVLCLLEGGYKPSLLSNDVCAVVSALLGIQDEPHDDDAVLMGSTPATDPKPSTVATLSRLIKFYAPHWKSLRIMQRLYN